MCMTGDPGRLGWVGVGRGPAPSCFPDREDGTVAATTAAPAAEEDLEKTKRASAGKAKEEACSACLGLLPRGASRSVQPPTLRQVSLSPSPFPRAPSLPRLDVSDLRLDCDIESVCLSVPDWSERLWSWTPNSIFLWRERSSIFCCCWGPMNSQLWLSRAPSKQETFFSRCEILQNRVSTSVRKCSRLESSRLWCECEEEWVWRSSERSIFLKSLKIKRSWWFFFSRTPRNLFKLVWTFVGCESTWSYLILT